MKKRIKKVATLCLAGVTAMSTVGVTGSAVFAKGDTNYDVDNMDFENVELRVAFRFNNGSDTDGQAKWYYKALEEFNKENEGKIHVTDESISTESDYEEKLTTDFASGNVPNAFLQYGGSRTREYVDAGYILDLTPYFEQYPEFRILHGRQHSLTALKEPMVFRGPLISSVSITTKITLIRLA